VELSGLTHPDEPINDLLNEFVTWKQRKEKKRGEEKKGEEKKKGPRLAF